MQAVADKVGVHGTTVSRTVHDKYMTTPFGTVELRRFFTSGLATEAGGQMSNVAVQDRLKALVDAEDKAHPLSDDRLAALLKAEGIEQLQGLGYARGYEARNRRVVEAVVVADDEARKAIFSQLA